jgi:hypothetical protein
MNITWYMAMPCTINFYILFPVLYYHNLDGCGCVVFNLTLAPCIVGVNGTLVKIVNIRVLHLTVHELPFR